MDAHEKTEARSIPRSSKGPEALTAAEWDRRFPGVLDAAGIMGGAANVILQLARAGVGYGVIESRVESGKLFRHPIKRTRTTITYLAVATLGTPAEKLAYREAVTKVHAQVRSTAESPVKYHALDPELQLWVAACLYFGFVDNLRKLRGELDPATADALYAQLATLGTTLQVRPEMWPPTRAAFEAYFARELEKLQIDEPVRAYLTALTDLKFLHPLLRRIFAPLHRFLTIGYLPPPIREQMRFSFTEAQQKRFDRFIAFVAAVNRMLPRVIRCAPTQLVMLDFRIRLRAGLPLV